jgi:hypothetical protein
MSSNAQNSNMFNSTTPLQALELTTDVQGMDALLTRHIPGTPFEYVNVSNTTSQTRREIVDKLRSGIVQAPSSFVERIEPYTIELKKWQNVIHVTKLLTIRQRMRLSKWSLIEEMQVVFCPTISYTDQYASLTISLIDSRQEDVRSQRVRSFTGNTNVGVCKLLSLDYSVRSKDLKLLKLSIECSNSGLIKGMIWGIVQVKLKIRTSNMPMSDVVKPIAANLNMPSSALTVPRHNPKELDLRITDYDVKELRKLYNEGAITDATRASNRQSRMAYAGSVIGSDLSNERANDFDKEEADRVESLRAQGLEKERQRLASPPPFPGRSDSPVDVKGKSVSIDPEAIRAQDEDDLDMRLNDAAGNRERNSRPQIPSARYGA